MKYRLATCYMYICAPPPPPSLPPPSPYHAGCGVPFAIAAAVIARLADQPRSATRKTNKYVDVTFSFALLFIKIDSLLPLSVFFLLAWAPTKTRARMHKPRPPTGFSRRAPSGSKKNRTIMGPWYLRESGCGEGLGIILTTAESPSWEAPRAVSNEPTLWFRVARPSKRARIAFPRA